MKKVLEQIRQAGVVAKFDGNSLHLAKIPGWDVFVLAWEHRRQLCATALVAHVMRSDMQPQQPKKHCNFCNHFRQYTCEQYEKAQAGIPAAVLVKGCDKFSLNAGVYF